MKAHLESSRPHALTLIVIMGFLRMLLHSVRPRPEIQQTYVIYLKTSALLHCALSLAAQCIVIGPVCDWCLQRAGWRAGDVCLLPR